MSKRIKQKIKTNKEGEYDVSLTCKKCGKPITHSNKYGMYCDNECGIEDDKKSKTKIENIIKGFSDFK